MADKLIVAKTGNEAMAEAMRQINPDVCAAYPITPATEIMQIFARFVADGQVKTNLVTVESEHSAMSACIGASAAGTRVMTATSSQGLALMYEMLYIVAGLRLPIVMSDVNRTISAPINIHCDHGDTMGGRDAGWIQIFSENAQEAYDNLIHAVRIAEDPEVRLPAMVTTDGFIISHGMETMEMYDTARVQKFIGEFKPAYSVLDTEHPITVGAIDLFDFYFEHKRSQVLAMSKVKPVILKVAEEFNKEFKRNYGLFEAYCMDDAELVIVVLGSTAGTAKVAIDRLRASGVKAGMLKIRVFRPFPEKEIADKLRSARAVAILDRSEGMADTGGPLFAEVRAALYDSDKRPLAVDYIYGLGGRDINVEHIKSVYADLDRIARSKKIDKTISYINVRE